ncbi:MAG: hypothetical protein P8R37_11905 [Opitutae bacterium]|nr:hypothetical protein [Opitutae bacterium]
MKENLSKLFIQLSKRAEKTDQEALISSFVDIGPLSIVLSTIDNQVLYGRRGTGKTHALKYVSGLSRKGVMSLPLWLGQENGRGQQSASIF